MRAWDTRCSTSCLVRDAMRCFAVLVFQGTGIQLPTPEAAVGERQGRCSASAPSLLAVVARRDLKLDAKSERAEFGKHTAKFREGSIVFAHEARAIRNDTDGKLLSFRSELARKCSASEFAEAFPNTLSGL